MAETRMISYFLGGSKMSLLLLLVVNTEKSRKSCKCLPKYSCRWITNGEVEKEVVFVCLGHCGCSDVFKWLCFRKCRYDGCMHVRKV